MITLAYLHKMAAIYDELAPLQRVWAAFYSCASLSSNIGRCLFHCERQFQLADGTFGIKEVL